MKKDILEEHPERQKRCLNTPKLLSAVASVPAVHFTCKKARYLNMQIWANSEATFLETVFKVSSKYFFLSLANKPLTGVSSM